MAVATLSSLKSWGINIQPLLAVGSISTGDAGWGYPVALCRCQHHPPTCLLPAAQHLPTVSASGLASHGCPGFLTCLMWSPAPDAAPAAAPVCAPLPALWCVCSGGGLCGAEHHAERGVSPADLLHAPLHCRRPRAAEEHERVNNRGRQAETGTRAVAAAGEGFTCDWLLGCMPSRARSLP